MKEIFDSIWNAPKEEIVNTIALGMILYFIGTLIALLLSVFVIWPYMKKKMGFGKEWDQKWKKFDEDFKKF